MTSDSQDSRRKHRRSPSDDDSPEDSKRHKHRHHRHHHRRHRHHHRHSSKKRDEEMKNDEIEGNVEEVRDVAPPPADYDMEEGEIVEDEGAVVADAEAANRKSESDVESGEFKVVEGDDSYTRFDDAVVSPIANSLPATDHSKKKTKNMKSPGSDRSDDSRKHGSHHHHEESPIVENIIHHDYEKKYSKVEPRSHGRSKSPSKGSTKQKSQRDNERKHVSDLMEVDEDEYGDRRNSSSHKVKEKRLKESSRSPSHGRYRLETTDKSGSASPHQRRGRERSQSILYTEPARMRRHHERDERLYDNGKVQYELDNERDNDRSIDYDKEKGRETSSSYHRYRGKDGDGDSWDRERGEVHRDKNKVKEEVISRERSERDHDRDRDWERDRDKNRGRDRERERDYEKDRGKAREAKNDPDWNRERDRERRREKDRGQSRDRDLERERRRDDSVTYRDRSTDKDRVRDLEMDRGRDRNGDRDRYGDRTRDIGNERSRRHNRYGDHDDGYGYRDRRHGYDETDYRNDRQRKLDSEKHRNSKDGSRRESDNIVKRDDGDQKDYEERVELELAEQEEDDINRIKEESRRRREAILQKYKAKQSQQQAVPLNPQASNGDSKEQHPQNSVSTNTVQENTDVEVNGQDASANEMIFPLGKSPSRTETMDVEETTGAGGLGEGTPKSERSNDMFCDDIFGDSPAGVRKRGKGDGLPVERSGLHDNWDDPEGYYSFRFGEVLDGRYEITAAHGKGVFSTVVRAKDLKAVPGDREEVAIKIIRNNETMLKAGTEELVILKKLVGADPDDRRHCVRYLSHFKYRNHLCIVFESLHMNLREVLKKFGRNIGLKLTAVKAYAKQLFIALKHLRNCGVLHCDIKPDNMLVNDAKNVLKLCDFGNAMFAGKNEITPYLVSRFYRSPEIILGLPYDHPMDMWSVGCCLYELYTGKVLFPGPSNNDMLRLHMELKGPFPKKMLRKGAFIEQHFDQDLNFLATEEDPVTKKTIRRLILNVKPKDISTIIKGSAGEDPKMLANFKDLLDKIFVLDPDKRLTVSQALNHPFITGK